MSFDHEELKMLFFGALERTPEEVGGYLDAACGDDNELRREVESLLAHHDEHELVQATDSPRLTHALAQNGVELPQADPASRYREIAELGVGGCGRVTRSWDHTLRRCVARKELIDGRPVLRAILLQEARLLAWLDHPGSVPVYEIGDASDPLLSYTMRLLDGQTLRERMDRDGPLSVRESVRILARISETMANAHFKGVLHLDLKPANLMLLPYGQVYVLDWGVARFYDLAGYREYLRTSGEAEAPLVAGYQGIAGTPNYMPAEQATGGPLGPATDIYAAGTVLYEMLVGRLPHDTDGPETVKNKLSAGIRPLGAFRADIPERLQALCARMLCPDPEGRPPDFGEVLAELQALHSVELEDERLLQTGEILFREGDDGDEAFQILEGAVVVSVAGPSGPRELARRSVGDLIGELAVVSAAPRSATVTALEPTRVALVTGDVIARALEGASPLLAQMVRSLSDRLREEAERAKAT